MTLRGKSLSSPIHLLHRASQRADSLFARQVATGGLTPRQFAVLQAVSQRSGLSQTDIMAATGIDRSTTAVLVRRLVSDGCLQRRRTRQDTRAYSVRLTPVGQQMLTREEPAVRAAEEVLLSPIPRAERAAFLKALGLVAAGGASDT